MNNKNIVEIENNNKLTRYASIDKPWKKFYSKDALNIEIPKETIYDAIKRNCEEHPIDIAICYFGTKITYKKLLKKINVIANSFLEYGVKSVDIVTIAIPNTPENVIYLYALNKIGVVANLIDLRAKG